VSAVTMEHFFKSVHITNFKSLKDVTLSDCKRINLLLGKPNVGKSNILEAIGLFSLTYFEYTENLNEFMRLEHLSELFFDGDKENEIFIETDTGDYCNVNSKVIFSINQVVNANLKKLTLVVDNDFEIKEEYSSFETVHLSKVKYYKFPANFTLEKIDNLFLLPPFGVNLIEVIQENRELKKELIAIFAEYNLKLLFDKGNHSLRIIKETKDGEIFSLPISSIADTLQRLIFYKTAIASNIDSILLFEEPEAHCFPPYIAHFTQGVINSESNQFFIATHSPYVLNDFLEYKRDDIAIFMADFRDGQTVIKRLTDGEVNDVYEYGLDLFFNAELFTDEI
jgi:AAA15 family ATPase/GTPase